MDAAADAHRIRWRHRRSSSVRQIQGVTHGVWRNETRATQTMTGSQARRGEMPRRGNTSPRTSSCARPAVNSRRVGCVAAPASTSASSGPDRCPAHRPAPPSGSAARTFAALDGPGHEDGARRRAEMVRRAIQAGTRANVPMLSRHRHNPVQRQLVACTRSAPNTEGTVARGFPTEKPCSTVNSARRASSKTPPPLSHGVTSAARPD